MAEKRINILSEAEMDELQALFDSTICSVETAMRKWRAFTGFLPFMEGKSLGAQLTIILGS